MGINKAYENTFKKKHRDFEMGEMREEIMWVYLLTRKTKQKPVLKREKRYE